MPMVCARCADVALPAEGRACSTETRAVTEGGSTRVAVRLAAAARTAPTTACSPPGSRCPPSRAARGPATQSDTSLPVPIRITSGLPAGRVGQHVGALREPDGRRAYLRAVEGGQRLPGEDRAPTGSCRSCMMTRQASATSLASAGRMVMRPGIARSESELLDRLVGRAVLAHADGVVGEDVDDRDLHDRGQPDGRAAVVAEDQEARAVGPDLGERQAVQRSRPWRARGCRSGSCGRRRFRRGSRRRPRR